MTTSGGSGGREMNETRARPCDGSQHFADIVVPGGLLCSCRAVRWTFSSDAERALDYAIEVRHEGPPHE